MSNAAPFGLDDFPWVSEGVVHGSAQCQIRLAGGPDARQVVYVDCDTAGDPASWEYVSNGVRYVATYTHDEEGRAVFQHDATEDA